MDDILKQIKAGEVSGVQFKERILDKYDMGCEMVAFSNAHGGKGVNVTFSNNTSAQEFVITLWREESNEVEDLDTRLRHSDTDLDTKEGDVGTKRIPLTKKQKDIVNFCSVPRSTKEILDRIGVTMHSKNRERYITSLVNAGYLQMTNPDNPTASNQKYKKVIKQ